VTRRKNRNSASGRTAPQGEVAGTGDDHPSPRPDLWEKPSAVYTALPFLVVLPIGLLYAGLGSVALPLAVALAAGAAFLPGSPVRMLAPDWAALTLAAYEIPSLLLSQYRANSVLMSWTMLLAVLVYFAVRLTILKAPQKALFSALVASGGVWLALSAIGGFRENAQRLQSAGLADPVAFRARLIPAPATYVVGEWLTVPLLLLPFACALPAYLWQSGRNRLAALACAAPLAIAAALTLSCSRAVFWSMAVFCVALCAALAASRVTSIRVSLALLGPALLALVIVPACENAAYPGIASAYVGANASQTRSTEGRVGIWKRTADIVRAHPLWGVGSSNTALALASTGGQEDTAGMASRAFSLPAQVLAEKGIVGFLLYAAFLLLVGRTFVQTMRAELPGRDKAMACCFAAGLVAVLFRELTYSSVLEHTVTLALAMTLSALVVTCP
jgi:O-antigen ligase